MKRIGLFGGSFDPLHIGHVLVAKAAREELSLERLFLIPAAQSPFKPTHAPVNDAARLRMLRLAFAGDAACEIDTQELKRGGTSYSIDTVRDYAKRFPEAELLYLIGADHVPTLPKWRDADDLAKLTRFIVIPRPGETPTQTDPRFRIDILGGWPLKISSSEIRARVRSGLPVDFLTPPGVSDVIRELGLYC